MSISRVVSVALLAGLLAAYIFLVVLPGEQQLKSEQKNFEALPIESWQSLEVTQDKKSYTLVHASQHGAGADDNWQLASLPFAPLDPAKVQSIVSALRELDRGTALPPAEINSDLSVYGLAPAEMKLTLTLASAKQTILLGKINQYLNKRYLAFEGNPNIYLVSDTLFAAANQELNAFRRRTLLSFADSELAKIQVITPANSFALASNAETGWTIAEPTSFKASAEAVSSFTRDLRGLKAAEFIDTATPRLKDFGLDAPRATIVLSFNDQLKKPSLQVSIGKKGENYFGRIEGQPVIYSLLPVPQDLEHLEVDNFRLREIFNFNQDQVTQLDAQGVSGASVALSRKGEEWTVNGKPADPVFVQQLLQDLSSLQAERKPQRF